MAVTLMPTLGMVVCMIVLGSLPSNCARKELNNVDLNTVAKNDHGQRSRHPLEWSTLSQKIRTATTNLGNPEIDEASARFRKNGNKNRSSIHPSEGRVSLEMSEYYVPGQPADAFSLDTITGKLSYPSERFRNASFIFHTFDNRSAFLECIWTKVDSLQAIASSPASVNYVFMSPSNKAKEDAYWMQGQLTNAVDRMMMRGTLREDAWASLKDRFHFVTTPTYQLGNWIPGVLMEWACEDHGCGFSQAVFRSTTGKTQTMVLKRLDARYDWLPSPADVFTSSQPVVLVDDGCQTRRDVTNKIAVVVDGNCSYSKKITNMQKSSALGVIVYAKPSEPVQDMNCEGAECDSPPSIPAAMIPYSDVLIESMRMDTLNVSFQTTPSENFYFAIDRQGLLAEMGWLLYPTFQFFVWQAQWFDYKTDLLTNLSQKADVIPVINATIMDGKTGIVETVNMPSLSGVSRIELDASLSCPGERDEACPPWDHTVHLYLCCDRSSPLCGTEVGRWITPFRRRIGRWLTDITPLAPLFNSSTCTFNMKSDAWWAQPWKPSLNIRLYRSDSVTSTPQRVIPLFQGGTFNQSYNSNYKPFNFTMPSNTEKVMLYAVITGHGSDNNGCGEFCVTSHHFIVNGKPNVIKFDNAGTPTGCADRTPTGVTPNEHGTWLYGRDGWCDGREVDPWVVDVTPQLDPRSSNSVTYFGWFNGTDPNPSSGSTPGEIIMYSYLVFYGEAAS